MIMAMGQQRKNRHKEAKNQQPLQKQIMPKPKTAKLRLIAALKSLSKSLPACASQKPNPMLVTSQNKMWPQPNQQRKNRREKPQKKHQQKLLMRIMLVTAPIMGHPPTRQHQESRSVQPRKMLSKLVVMSQNLGAADGGQEARQLLPFLI